MRYVLLLQADKASAFAFGRAEFGAAVIFNNDAAGQENFTRYLQERQHSLFSIVLDSKDEEHHLDAIPQLSGADHRRLLKKVSARHFPGNLLSSIAVDKKKHSVDNVCSVTVSGLPPNHDCEAWLKLLKRASALMVGISSLSLLGLAIHKVSGHHTSLCVLQVAYNDFRMMAYHNSRLIICRHVTVAEDSGAELIEQLRQTQLYLDRMPLALEANNKAEAASNISQPDDARLFDDVQVVGTLSAAGRAALERVGASVIGCGAMSRMLGIKPEISAPFAGLLFAALALNKQSKQARLSMGSYKNSFLARRLRHALYGGSIACLGVTAAATGAAVHYNESYSLLISSAQTLSAAIPVHDEQRSVAYLELDTPIDAIRDSMRIAHHINARSQITPLHFLSSLAAGLTDYTELEVTSIQWSGTPADYSHVLLDIEEKGGSMNHYSATVTGNLQMLPSDRGRSVGRFNSFITALKATRQYLSIHVVDDPFSSGGRLGLSGSDHVMVGSQPALKVPFSIDIVIRAEWQ